MSEKQIIDFFAQADSHSIVSTCFKTSHIDKDLCQAKFCNLAIVVFQIFLAGTLIILKRDTESIGLKINLK